MTYLRFAGIVGALLALVAAYGMGRSDGRALNEAKHVKAAQLIQRASDKIITAAHKVQMASVTAERRRKDIMGDIRRELPKIVVRPVYRNECFDADGMRALTRAIEAANSGRSALSGADGGTGKAEPAAQR